MKPIYFSENLFQSEIVTDLVPALVKFNALFHEATLIKDKKNEHLKNAYLSLDNILNVIRPLLTECGLFITQDLAGDYLTTIIYHVSGQYKGSMMPFSPMTGNRGTNPLQDLGGGITYAKRYSISACLGISVDTDTDAQDSKISAQQLKRKPTLSNERIDGLVKHLQTFSESEQTAEFEKIKEKFDISQAQIKNIYERIKL
jgi:hypothetical protein